MNRSFSKIRHIQEANLKLEKRLISEQSNVEQGDASECAKKYVNFAFEPTVLEPDEETGKGFVVIDGGDLYYWNKNMPPTRGDKGAYDRFINYIKSVDYLFDDEECTGIKFEDMEPFLKKLYYDQIDKSRDKPGMELDSIMRRRNSQIKDLIDKKIKSLKGNGEDDVFQRSYDDAFSFAEIVIEETAEELQELSDFPDYPYNQIIDNLKQHYGDYVLSNYDGDDEYSEFFKNFKF
jgi:hypothetical protein